MALRDFTAFNSSGWAIGKVKTGKNNTVVTLDTESLQIQPPAITTVEDLNLLETDLKFTFFKLGDDKKSISFKEWLTAFDTAVVELLYKNKETVWGDGADSMSKEVIEDQYKNSVTSKGKIKIYLNRDKNTKIIKLPVVDKNNKVLDIKEVSCDTDVLSIVRCRYIRIGSTDISPQWEMISLNVKEEKTPETLACIIHDEDSDSDDDFEMITED